MADFLPGCGCLPRTTAYGKCEATPPFADDWVIDQSKWQNVDLSLGWKFMVNQNPFGWCCWYAAAQVVMVCQTLNGQPHELLLPDAGPVYLGTGDTGYAIDDALSRFVLPIGFPPATAVISGDVNPLAYNKKLQRIGQLASNWKDIAAVRKLTAYHDCRDMDQLGSALQRGMVVEAGLLWQDNPRGGHAVPILEMVWKDGEWWYGGPNNWGGLNGWYDHPTKKGWFLIPVSHWRLDLFGGWGAGDAAWAPEDNPVPEAA